MVDPSARHGTAEERAKQPINRLRSARRRLPAQAVGRVYGELWRQLEDQAGRCGRGAHDLGKLRLQADLLNALNDTAEEGLATDNFFSPNFGRPIAFIDPRRAMVSVRLNLGR